MPTYRQLWEELGRIINADGLLYQAPSAYEIRREYIRLDNKINAASLTEAGY